MAWIYVIQSPCPPYSLELEYADEYDTCSIKLESLIWETASWALKTLHDEYQ